VIRIAVRGSADRPRVREGCMRVLKLLRALGPRKNEAEKWSPPPLRSQLPDNSIVRRRVDAQHFLHKNWELVVPCLPILFTSWSVINYSRGALR